MQPKLVITPGVPRPKEGKVSRVDFHEHIKTQITDDLERLLLGAEYGELSEIDLYSQCMLIAEPEKRR